MPEIYSALLKNSKADSKQDLSFIVMDTESGTNSSSFNHWQVDQIIYDQQKETL